MPERCTQVHKSPKESLADLGLGKRSMSAISIPAPRTTTLPVFTVVGVPRTKKNSSRILWLKTKGWSAKVARLNGGLEAVMAGFALSKAERDIVFEVMGIVKDSGDGVPILKPSEAYEQWFKDALWQAPEICRNLRRDGVQLPIKQPVNVCARFYRERLSGDACGFYQALGDWLQAPRDSKTKPGKRSREGAGIIDDDSLIASWDGSLLLKDAVRPRVEVTISLIETGQIPMPLGEEF